MFVELHIIQNFPPSNLNRDDLGQPKTADFGGYPRARVSSQCFKRSTRYAGQNEATGVRPLFERLTPVPLGKRTARIVEELRAELVAAGKPPDEAQKVAIEFARVYSSKKGKMNSKRPDETSVLLYVSQSERKEVVSRLLKMDWAQLLLDIEAAKPKKAKADGKEEDEEKAAAKSPLKKLADDFAQATKGRSSAPDIALFGRMLADRPETNVDAACQVAHAISTHSIAGRTPIDYYTAMDDLKPKTDAGAGFLDVAYFNSACFYRYARLDYEQLKTNLGDKDLQGNDLADLPLRTVEAFLRASEAAIPTGKKNSSAHECRPSFMLAVVREKESAGWSLVNAFQKPVNVRSKGEEDLVLASVKRLEKQFEHLRTFYADDTGDTVKAIAVALPDGTVQPEDLGEDFRANVKNMKDWVETVCDELRKGG